MKLTFSPIRADGALTLARSGDTLTINDEPFDFAPVPPGATLPRAAIASPWIAGDVTRDAAGILTVPLILPHGAGAAQDARFPAPLTLTADGPVPLPPHATGTEGPA
ncbi:hypothetical protein [Roseovarius sp.]|uniref:hypothetical protein n=1 Tax=Roseovarius sp. TaxID=1486281 RepID=UPI003BA9D34D